MTEDDFVEAVLKSERPPSLRERLRSWWVSIRHDRYVRRAWSWWMTVPAGMVVAWPPIWDVVGDHVTGVVIRSIAVRPAGQCSDEHYKEFAMLRLWWSGKEFACLPVYYATPPEGVVLAIPLCVGKGDDISATVEVPSDQPQRAYQVVLHGIVSERHPPEKWWAAPKRALERMRDYGRWWF